MTTHPPADAVASATRRAVVELLRRNAADAGRSPAMTAAEVGDALELHVTTARFHLEILVQARQVASSFVRGGVGRPRKVYVATPSESLASPEAFGAFARLLSTAYADDRPAPDGGPEAAGERWVAERADPADRARPRATTPGTWLAKVGLAVDLLDEWGYEPEVRTSQGGASVELELRDCPFFDLARARSDLVCGIHRGLLRGTLAAVGEDAVDVELHPFVTERTCLAHLTTTVRLGRRRPGTTPP